MQRKKIVLLAINARYAHTSFAARCLRANLGVWRDDCAILEFDIKASPARIVEQLSAQNIELLGISVYIWNVNIVCEVVRLLREREQVPLIVLGGPEAGYLPENHFLMHQADIIIRGEGETAFRNVCDRFFGQKTAKMDEKTPKNAKNSLKMVKNEGVRPVFCGSQDHLPSAGSISLKLEGERPREPDSVGHTEKDCFPGRKPVKTGDFERFCAEIIVSDPENLENLVLPYAEYTEEDLSHRIIYVESSRGCPFGCEYCISALEKGVRYYDRKRLFAAFDDLFARGARQFRFLDRSFNIHDDRAAEMLRFFRKKGPESLDLHFELIPDRLGDLLRHEIGTFPPEILHFEVGIQTYNPEVAERINRRCDFDAADQNLRFLAEKGVKVHADLIAGLPGEDFSSFSTGFDRLLACKPSEIQVGVLKKLFGAPIDRHTDPFGMVYSPEPPYEVLQTAAVTRQELDDIKRFAAFWERLYNRGDYPCFMQALLAGEKSSFEQFSALSDHLFAVFQRTYGIPMLEMIREMMQFAIQKRHMPGKQVKQMLLQDYLQDGKRIKPPGFLTA